MRGRGLFIYLGLAAIGLIAKASATLGLALNSDDCQPGVIFYELAETGSLKLRDWFIVTNNHLFTELPLYLGLGAAVGMGPSTIRIGALIVYLISLGGVAAVLTRAWGMRVALASVAALSTTAYATHILLHAYVHTGAVAATFWLMFLASYLIEDDSGGIPRMGLGSVLIMSLLFMLSWAAAFSNPFFLVAFTLPVTLSLFALALTSPHPPLLGPRTILMALLPLSGVLALVAQRYSDAFGLNLSRLPSDHASWGQMLSNARALIGGLAALQGVWSGVPGWHMFTLSPANLLLACVPVLAMLALAPSINRLRPLQRFVLMYMLIASALLVAAYLLKAQTATRYLTPIHYVLGCGLAIVLAGDLPLTGRPWGPIRKALLGMLIVSGLYNSYANLTFREPQQIASTLQTIKAEGLTYGYASYWQANLMTVLSGGRVRVRPVEYKNYALGQYLWVSNSGWYRPSRHEGPTFLVVRPGEREQGFGALGPDVLASMFGPPSRVIEADEARVYVWDYNIMKASLKRLDISERTPRRVGRVIAIPGAGGHAIESAPGERGHLIYGTTWPLMPDAPHRVRYTVRLDGAPAGTHAADAQVFYTDIGAGSFSQTPLREERIMVGKSDGYMEMWLDFTTLDGGAGRVYYEFRLMATGGARVSLIGVTVEEL